jgi:NAD(P)-dependent dehydrogenase (short-subunit alcohol dehydrogenase family)
MERARFDVAGDVHRLDGVYAIAAQEWLRKPPWQGCSAITFAREGADVALSFVEAEIPDAQDVAKLIEAEGRKAVLLPGDITDKSFCETLVKQAVAELGRLDILVNNAGKQTNQKNIGDISDEQFDRTLKTNLYAMFWITKAALPHMPAGTSINNTASVVTYNPPEILVDYATTKAGIVAFSKALAKQQVAKGIRVNAVAPGPFWTALQPSGGQPQENVEKFGSEVPLGRPGHPVELAPVYVFLASQEASYVTGEVYGATGGNGTA